MTIDKEKLQALAQAAISEGQQYGERWPQDDDWFEPELVSAALAYVKGASPETILEMLWEIEYLELEMRGVERVKAELAAKLGCADEPRWKWMLMGADGLLDERDQLKAENEALRKDAERYRWLRRYTVKSLPVAGALDSLDSQIDAVMAKEAK